MNNSTTSNRTVQAAALWAQFQSKLLRKLVSKLDYISACHPDESYSALAQACTPEAMQVIEHLDIEFWQGYYYASRIQADNAVVAQIKKLEMLVESVESSIERELGKLQLAKIKLDYAAECYSIAAELADINLQADSIMKAVQGKSSFSFIGVSRPAASSIYTYLEAYQEYQAALIGYLVEAFVHAMEHSCFPCMTYALDEIKRTPGALGALYKRLGTDAVLVVSIEPISTGNLF